MSAIDDAIRANQNYSQGFNLANLAMPPARKLAIVACMDARLTLDPMLGLKTGEAHIIRNASGGFPGHLDRNRLVRGNVEHGGNG